LCAKIKTSNLLLRLPCLTVEDLEAIAGAVGVGPSGRITWHSYYRAAARELAPEGEGVAIGWKSSAV